MVNVPTCKVLISFIYNFLNCDLKVISSKFNFLKLLRYLNLNHKYKRQSQFRQVLYIFLYINQQSFSVKEDNCCSPTYVINDRPQIFFSFWLSRAILRKIQSDMYTCSQKKIHCTKKAQDNLFLIDNMNPAALSRVPI